MKDNVIDLVAARMKRQQLATPNQTVSFDERLSRIKKAIERINDLMADLKKPKQ